MTVTMISVVVGIHIRCTLDKVSRCAATSYILASVSGGMFSGFPGYLYKLFGWLVVV